MATILYALTQDPKAAMLGVILDVVIVLTLVS
jgi:hypothetical protein